MKLRHLSLFLMIVLVCSMFCGCSEIEEYITQIGTKLGMGSTETETIAATTAETTVPEDNDFVAYYAQITQDNLVLRKEPKSTGEILGTVKTGDRLLVQQIIQVDGVEWASTDRGWILAEHVRAETGTVTESDTNATVIFDDTQVYCTAMYNDAAIYVLQAGDRVKITKISHYGSDIMAYVQNGWVKMSRLTFDGCAVSGMIPGSVNIGCANVRNGPSTDYDIVGNVYRDETFNFKSFSNSVLNGKPWGGMEDGRWLFVEYITFADGIVYEKGENAD